jgi:hypothetical protein
MELFIVAGLVTAFNLVIVHYKLKKGRVIDALLDVGAFVFLVWLFKDAGQGGIVIGMVASFMVSMYLLYFHKPKPTPAQIAQKEALALAKKQEADERAKAREAEDIRKLEELDRQSIQNWKMMGYMLVGFLILVFVTYLMGMHKGV